MKHRITVLLATGLSGILLSPAQAFDGRHKGFSLGIGLGGGATSFRQFQTTPPFQLESRYRIKPAAVTDFRLGWGISERWAIQYDNQVPWWGLGGSVMATGTTTLGASCFLRPSTYLTAGLGTRNWGVLSENGSSTKSGFGFVAGVGTEFRPHWAVESTLSYGSPFRDENVTSFAVMIQHHWY